MNASELLAAMKRTVEQLAAFNDIAKALTSTLELHEVLELVMQKVSGLLRPRNWSLLILDERQQRLRFELAVGEGADRLLGETVGVGEGIAGRVFATGQPLRVEDVSREPGFSPRFDALSTFRTHSALAVPLKARGRNLGVIELVNGEGDPPFTQEDLQAVVAIADFAAIGIENARNFQRVQELTLTDEHTGLHNARHLRGLLEQEVARAGRFGHPLSLIFLDLDRFKEVNDTHGHLVGSELLRQVGEVLLACIRQVDFAFRYGGDEFALLLVETDAAGAERTALRVRDELRTRSLLEDQGLSIKLSASLGTATFPLHASGGLELLERADRAMYQAKAGGRDRVVVAQAGGERAALPPLGARSG